MNSINDNANYAIQVKGLKLAYGDFVIMHDVDFTVKFGDIFIIMGGSGCGKSTLLKALSGLKKAEEGSIDIMGIDFLSSDKENREKIMHKTGILYQSGALFSSMTLAENIALPLEQYTDYSKEDISELASLKLALVGLRGFEDFYPAEISGGMKKRAGLARALALDPSIVYFDEPSAGLDPVSSKLLDDLILEINANLGTTIVIVTHELSSIFAIGKDSIFLDATEKTVIGRGSPEELLKNPPNDTVLSFLTRGEKGLKI